MDTARAGEPRADRVHGHGAPTTDGTIASCLWDFDNDGLFDDATGESVPWTFAKKGTYTGQGQGHGQLRRERERDSRRERGQHAAARDVHVRPGVAEPA